MELQAYLASWQGKWFSQRTHYNFQQQQAENHKSELAIEVLTELEPDFQAALEQHQIPVTEAPLAVKVNWDTSVDWGKPKQTGGLVYVFVPTEQSGQGTLLRLALGPVKGQALQGKYVLAPDESLSLWLQDQETRIEERLWFASPNLRLRTCLIQQGGQFSYSAFYSEIRKLSSPTQ
ncbi:phycobiliprotein lyase [Synechocystis sp. LKSZ1]|uniref:phycobiliprotein lyase n=1 Tax=Synechocystis sp. LKSZ1 TaxID=3144951 RepID=UPI00336BF661